MKDMNLNSTDVIPAQYLLEFEGFGEIIHSQWATTAHLRHAKASIRRLQKECDNKAVIDKCDSLIVLIDNKIEKVNKNA